MIGTTDAGVQIVPIGSGDAYGHRTDAHDPEGPVADEGEFASGAGVLFASGIKQSRVHNPISATSEICDTTLEVDHRPSSHEAVGAGGALSVRLPDECLLG